MTIDEFIIKVYNSNQMLQYWSDWDSLLQLKPSDFSGDNTFGKVRDELNLDYFIREARLIRYLTPESMEIIYDEIEN